MMTELCSRMVIIKYVVEVLRDTSSPREGLDWTAQVVVEHTYVLRTLVSGVQDFSLNRVNGVSNCQNEEKG